MSGAVRTETIQWSLRPGEVSDCLSAGSGGALL